MVDDNIIQTRNLDVNSSKKLHESDFNQSIKIRNLGVILDESLIFKHKLAAVRKRAIWGLINIAKPLKFVNREFKQKLVRCLVLTQLYFSNTLLYGLSNIDLYSLQLILKAAVRNIYITLRFSTEKNLLKRPLTYISYMLQLEQN